MISRSQMDLAPEMRERYENFAAEMKLEKIDFILTCTYRSDDEQARLYAQGRTKPGKIVTHAAPGQSAHNVRLMGRPAAMAFDIVIMDGGKCIWDVKDPRWLVAGLSGEACDLEWSGRWKKFVEFPHFQKPGWKPPKGLTNV